MKTKETDHFLEQLTTLIEKNSKAPRYNPNVF